MVITDNYLLNISDILSSTLFTISFNLHSNSGIDIIIIPISQMEDRDLREDELLAPNHTANKGLRFKAGQGLCLSGDIIENPMLRKEGYRRGTSEACKRILLI